MSAPSAPQVARLPLSLDQSLQFYWDPPTSDGGSAILDYRLTLIKQSDNTMTQITVQPNELSYYTVTGLTNAQTYTSYVEARNSVGYGPAAYFRDYQPGASAPNRAASATATAVGTSSALVSWTAPTGYNPATDPTIFWYAIESSSTNPSDAIVKRTGNGLTQTNLVITGLNQNSLYTFTVRPVNCPGYATALTTNQIGFYSPGTAKLATRLGTASTSSVSYYYTSITPDASGNVYVIAYMADNAVQTIYNYSSAPVGGGQVGTSVWGTISKSESYRTSCLIKYNSEGQAQWATILPRTEETTFANEASDIICDNSGNIYILGCFGGGSFAINNSVSTGGTMTPTLWANLTIGTGAFDKASYIIKYDSSGNPQWATSIVPGGGADTLSLAGAVDSSNNLYVSFLTQNTTLTFNNFVSMSANTVNVTSWGTYAVPSSAFATMLVRYTTSGANQGDVAWVSGITNLRTDASALTGVAVDTSNNVYLLALGAARTYTITNPNSTGGAGFSLTSFGTIANAGTGGLVLVKYNSSGTPQLATRVQTTTASVQGNRKLYISCDSNTNIYIGVGLSGNATGPFVVYNNSGSGTSTTEYGRVLAEAYETTVLMKYNSSLSNFWTTAIRGSSNAINKSYCDLAGNFYVGLQASNNITLVNYQSAPSGSPLTFGLSNYGNVTYSGGASNQDVFIAKYNTNGAVSWATRMGTSLNDSFSSVHPDNLGNIWFVGVYGDNTFTINNYSNAPSPPGTGNVSLSTYGTLPDTPSTSNNISIVKFAA